MTDKKCWLCRRTAREIAQDLSINLRELFPTTKSDEEALLAFEEEGIEWHTEEIDDVGPTSITVSYCQICSDIIIRRCWDDEGWEERIIETVTDKIHLAVEK